MRDAKAAISRVSVVCEACNKTASPNQFTAAYFDAIGVRYHFDITCHGMTYGVDVNEATIANSRSRVPITIGQSEAPITNPRRWLTSLEKGLRETIERLESNGEYGTQAHQIAIESLAKVQHDLAKPQGKTFVRSKPLPKPDTTIRQADFSRIQKQFSEKPKPEKQTEQKPRKRLFDL